MPCPSLSFSFTLLSHSCLLFFSLVFILAAYFLVFPPLPAPFCFTILMLIHNLSPHRSSFSSSSFSPQLQLHSFTLFSYLILSILPYLSDSAPSVLHLFSSSHFPPGSGVSTCLFEPPPLHVPSLPPPHKLSILSLVQQQDVWLQRGAALHHRADRSAAAAASHWNDQAGDPARAWHSGPAGPGARWQVRPSNLFFLVLIVLWCRWGKQHLCLQCYYITQQHHLCLGGRHLLCFLQRQQQLRGQCRRSLGGAHRVFHDFQNLHRHTDAVWQWRTFTIPRQQLWHVPTSRASAAISHSALASFSCGAVPEWSGQPGSHAKREAVPTKVPSEQFGRGTSVWVWSRRRRPGHWWQGGGADEVSGVEVKGSRSILGF